MLLHCESSFSSSSSMARSSRSRIFLKAHILGMSTSRAKLLYRRKFGLAFRRALIHGDGKVAAHRVRCHDGHHIHGSALAPEFDGLRERGGIDLLVVEHLSAETDDGGVFFIQTG